MNDARPIDSADRLLRLPEVLARVGIGKTQVYQMIKENTFPAPIRVSPHRSRWRDREIDDWIRDRPRAERAEPAELAGRQKARARARRFTQ